MTASKAASKRRPAKTSTSTATAPTAATRAAPKAARKPSRPTAAAPARPVRRANAPHPTGDSRKGVLVAVEGVDGSGKSTQVHLLHEWLKGLGCKVYFSTWNSSDLVRTATKRGKKEQLLTPTTFSLIHATDFADRYERQILPRLQAGYIVLCDRYIYTAFARDGVRGCDPGWLRRLYGFAQKPDITLHFNVPLDVSLDRILSGRPDLKYHEAGMDLDLHPDIKESYKIFQGRVHKLYTGMAKEFGFTVVDSTKAIHDIQEGVRALVQKKIDLSAYQSRSRVYGGNTE